MENQITNPYPTHDSKGRQIIYIDASSLKDFACRRKFYWNTIVGWRAKTRFDGDYRMDYGTAFHKFLELYYSGNETESAITKALELYKDIKVPVDDYRDIFHLEMSIREYAKKFPLEFDNLKAAKGFTESYMVEQKFTIPYKIINDKYVIVLCGTIDLIGTYNNIPCIADHKSTSGNPFKYFEEYELGIQPMFYIWIDKLINKRTDPLMFIINGLFLKKPTDKNMGKGMWDGLNVVRSQPIIFNNDQLVMFEKWVDNAINTIVLWIKDESKYTMADDFELSACKTPYGLCKYFKVCKMGDNTEHRNMILNSFYEKRHYNPLMFGVKEV